MNTDFINWLERELDKRNWNHSDLARAAGRSYGAISHLTNGLSNPTIGICNDMADAMNIPRKLMRERAGLIEREEGQSDIIDELSYLANLLPEADQIDLLDNAKAKLRRKNERKNKGTQEDCGETVTV